MSRLLASFLVAIDAGLLFATFRAWRPTPYTVRRRRVPSTGQAPAWS